jgi:hypothetical protein
MTKKKTDTEKAFDRIDGNFRVIKKEIENILEFVRRQNEWNKNLMNEQKRLFNYLVEVDNLIKTGGGNDNH